MNKKLVITSLDEEMIIEPLDTFKCVSFSLKDRNDHEWNDFILDTENMKQIIDFLKIQLKKSKKKEGFNRQRFN